MVVKTNSPRNQSIFHSREKSDHMVDFDRESYPDVTKIAAAFDQMFRNYQNFN